MGKYDRRIPRLCRVRIYSRPIQRPEYASMAYSTLPLAGHRLMSVHRITPSVLDPQIGDSNGNSRLVDVFPRWQCTLSKTLTVVLGSYRSFLFRTFKMSTSHYLEYRVPRFNKCLQRMTALYGCSQGCGMMAGHRPRCPFFTSLVSMVLLLFTYRRKSCYL